MKKTIQNSGFKLEQKVEVQGVDFMASEMALDTLINKMEGYALPVRYKWIDKDGEPVDNPTEEQVTSEQVRQVFDPFATFHPNNLTPAFNISVRTLEEAQHELNMTNEFLEARRRLMEIKFREAEAGRTHLIEDLMKEVQDKEEFNLKSVVNESK